MRETKYDRVHVVTVMHNNAATLRGYLNALAAAPARIATVTLVDNASSDGSASLARALADDLPFPVEVIDNRNTGFAGGYLAARASGAERGLPVLCLNPDVQLTVGAVQSLVGTMNALPGAAVVTIPLIAGSGEEDSASRRRLPRLGASVVYSVLGRLTPAKLRYNRRAADDAGQLAVLPTGEVVHRLEATTGALMLVDPAFRSLDEGIFDVDYWM